MGRSLLTMGIELSIIAEERCPRCRAALFIRPACCGMRKKGWKTVLKCTRAGCGYKRGHQKK